MKTPPSKGPATDAIPHIPPISPKAAGLFRSGTVNVSSLNIKDFEGNGKATAVQNVSRGHFTAISQNDNRS